MHGVVRPRQGAPAAMAVAAAATLALAMGLARGAAAGSDTPPAGGPDLAALAAEVRAAEAAFARSMAERSLADFERHLAPEAIFFGGPEPLRGRAAVVEGWRAFFDGEAAPFSWSPQDVEVLASGALAHSSGPVRAPDGTVISTFNSIWRRDPDGRWRVVFDKGCRVCRPCPGVEPAAAPPPAAATP